MAKYKSLSSWWGETLFNGIYPFTLKAGDIVDGYLANDKVHIMVRFPNLAPNQPNAPIAKMDSKSFSLVQDATLRSFKSGTVKHAPQLKGNVVAKSNNLIAVVPNGKNHRDVFYTYLNDVFQNKTNFGHKERGDYTGVIIENLPSKSSSQVSLHKVVACIGDDGKINNSGIKYTENGVTPVFYLNEGEYTLLPDQSLAKSYLSAEGSPLSLSEVKAAIGKDDDSLNASGVSRNITRNASWNCQRHPNTPACQSAIKHRVVNHTSAEGDTLHFNTYTKDISNDSFSAEGEAKPLEVSIPMWAKALPLVGLVAGGYYAYHTKGNIGQILLYATMGGWAASAPAVYLGIEGFKGAFSNELNKK